MLGLGRPNLSDGEISLYFGLQKGQNADLEVVALAALEWVAAMRAGALKLDPEAQFELSLSMPLRAASG